MGSKGGGTVQNYERQLSQQELDLLETQNEMLNAGIGIAQEQENRSADQYQQWQNTYEPIETGIIPLGATRENGYYSPEQTAGLFQAPIAAPPPPPPVETPVAEPAPTKQKGRQSGTQNSAKGAA